MTEPSYRPRRGKEDKPDARPPLSQRARDMMKPPPAGGGNDALGLTGAGNVEPTGEEPGAGYVAPGGREDAVASRPMAPPALAPAPAAAWAPASGWLLWELAVVVLATVAVSLIEGLLLRADVVKALAPDTQLVVRGAVVFIYYGILFALVWWLAARRQRPLARAVGLRPFEWGVSLLRVLLYLIVVRAASFAYAALLYFARIHMPGQKIPDLTRLFGPGIAGLALTLVIAVFVGPLVEEIIFRGVVFGALSDLLPGWLAVAGSALIFAALHFNVYLFIPAFVVGVALAMIYARSGSLWPAVILHSLYNLTAIILAYWLR